MPVDVRLNAKLLIIAAHWRLHYCYATVEVVICNNNTEENLDIQLRTAQYMSEFL